MSSLLGAEVLKLLTTRAWIGYVAAVVALSALGAAVTIGSAHGSELEGPHFQRDLFSHSGVAGLVALLVGITAVTVEWRHGTVTRTFLISPRRELVLTAKGVVCFLAGIALAIVSVVVVLAVAIPWLSIDGASLEPGHFSGLIARIVLAAALWGALGAAFGAVAQNQTFALVAALLWVVIVEALLALLLGLVDLGGAADYFPAQALGALESTGEGGLSPAAGAAVGVAYVATFGALGLFRVLRQDIT
jgi:ABC-2 type transport system permease protein